MTPYNSTQNRLNLSRVRPASGNGLNILPKDKSNRLWQKQSGFAGRGKQWVRVFLSDTMTVAGLIGVSTTLLMAGGRAQLANQAKSELAVSQIEYEANGDFSSTQDVLQSGETSYSHIYLRQPTGEFELVNSVSGLDDSVSSERLLNSKILDKALAADGQAITHRLVLQDQRYTVAAQALDLQTPHLQMSEAQSGSATVLVRGISEHRLNNLLFKSLALQLLIAMGVLLTDRGVAVLRGRTRLSIIKRLQKIAQQFTVGNRPARETVASAECYALTQTDLLDQVQTLAKRDQQLYTITTHLRASLTQSHILETAVCETRAAIDCDRIVVYSFDETWQATTLADSDARFEHQLCVESPAASLANLAVPILVNGQLLGLFVAYRDWGWQHNEISFLNQVAGQMGYALEQAQLLQQTEHSWQFAETLCDQKHQKEQLQHQLIALLNQLESVSRGDLTVRADVTNDEIGIFADCFNSLLERMRQVIMTVGEHTTQTQASLDQSDIALQTLESETSEQIQAVGDLCESVESLQQSLQRAQSITQQAQVDATTTSKTASFNEIILEQTAQTLLNLQEVIQITTQKTKSLEDAAQQMSQQVAWLDQISVQTHLLAINAGLEATKADSENLTYAIATDEISQLASQARQIIQSFEATICKMRAETHQAAELMIFGKAQALEGLHLVDQSKQSMTDILSASSQIGQSMQSMDETTISQAMQSQIILNVSHKIAQGTEQVSNSSHLVANWLQQTARLADTLQTSVSTLKVEANS